MGTASVSCAPPCTCAPNASPNPSPNPSTNPSPSHPNPDPNSRCTALESLDSYVPTERVSVTRLRAVRLARGGGGGECVLRITSHLGPISRGEVYVVNSLILSSSRTGTSLGAHDLTLAALALALALALTLTRCARPGGHRGGDQPRRARLAVHEVVRKVFSTQTF